MYDYFYGLEAEQFSFYRIPKVLFTQNSFKEISFAAKALYGILLDRMNLSLKNGWKDETGKVYIFFPIEEIMEALNCGNKKALSLLAELESNCGLIERRRQGLGRPNRIYVKNFMIHDLTTHTGNQRNGWVIRTVQQFLAKAAQVDIGTW